ncbi:MAG: hypothetical protein QXU88_02390 [Candidatus Woesearchaeota archaeon]
MMMKFAKGLSLGLMAALFAIIFASSTFALDASFSNVEIDGTELVPNEQTRLSLERGNEFALKVTIEAGSNIKNAELEAFISGYEYGDIEPIHDRVGPFDLEANTSYSKKLKLKLPSDVDVDSYKLRIVLSDRNGDALIESYNLKIDAPRHGLRISDIILRPDGNLFAGRSLLATVRLENTGAKTEENIKITVAIPELGLSDSTYLEELKAGSEESTEELYLRIPPSTKEGVYDFVAQASFDRKRGIVKEVIPIKILENKDYKSSSDSRPQIVLDQSQASVVAGSVASFQIKLTNNGKSASSFSLVVGGVDGWGEATLSPAPTLILEPGASGTFTLTIATSKKASGLKKVQIELLNSESKQVGQSQVQLEITPAPKTDLRAILEIAVIVLAALMIILLIVSTLRKGARSEVYY